LPLVFGASAGSFGRHDFRSLIYESVERLRVFIINIPFFLDAEKTLFFLRGRSVVSFGVIHIISKIIF
jgi:hypothetical protein